VLVVEDCPDSRGSLALLLRAWGHEVCLAADGPSALEAARSFHPQAVVLDISLPGMDGWELGRRLRQQGGLAQALLVARTGRWGQEAEARSGEAGLDGHLSKPADPEEIRRLLGAAAVPAGAG